jgi:Tfp pilus assembly protein PilO
MDKQDLIKRIQDPAVVDYTYGIAFFVVFIFFVVVIIGPNISTVFELSQQYADLKEVNTQYTTTIATINKLQSIIATRKDDFPLLAESLPDQVKISQVVTDLGSLPLSVSDAQEIVYPGFAVGTQSKVVDKKAKPNELKSFPIQFRVSGSQAYISSIIDRLMTQKRLKSISQYTVSPSSVASSSGTLDAQIQIEVYYQ